MNEIKRLKGFDLQFLDGVIGIDEVGYGAWAGPLVAAAVQIIDYEGINEEGIRIFDSKSLSRNQRELAYKYIEGNKSVFRFATSIISANMIDDIGVKNSNFLAMKNSYKKMLVSNNKVLIDGNLNPGFSNKIIMVKKGDTKSLAIAAASIVAKVTRDSIMVALDKKHPCYLWKKNVGYGTKAHKKAILENGMSTLHRKSYNILK